MTRRITIKEAKAAIRAGRRIQWISRYPVEAKILSSDGSYKHVVTGDTETPLWCQTCEGRGHSRRCWAVKRIEQAIIEIAATLPQEGPEPVPEPVREPRKLLARSWNQLYREGAA